MHDPKFENEVQQKLQELSFSPSEAVWTRVERAVNGEKKRRVPIFWFFLLPALTLTGAGIMYFSYSGTTTKQSKARSSVVSASGKPAAVVTPSGVQSKATPTEAATGTNTPGTVPSPVTASPMVVAPDAAKLTSATKLPVHTDPAIKPASSAYTTLVRTPGSPSSWSGSTPPADINASVTSAASKPAILPGSVAFDHHFSAPGAARLSPRSQLTATTKAPIQLKPKYTWETGFAGGIGASSLNKALFQQPVVMSDLAPSSAPISGRPKSYTSQIRPDLSYWAGIVAQRPLNSRFTLSLGLALHYYSTKIQIGEKVASAPIANYNTQSLLTNQSQLQAAAYPYYSVGDKDVFTNRYYFLELPVSVLWQISHIRHLPLFWETGVSYSYLMSSSALYYNTKSSVFYKDGGMINKNQLNLATALLIGLPVRGMRLQVGPQIQYGLTTLQNQGTSGQHLFYGGLRVVLLPGKAKK